MESEHHNKDKRTFSKGANSDISPELLGSENKGVYLDSENGRVSSDRGNKGDWEKIKGEETVWEQPASGSWYNLYSVSVNTDVFEIWVKKNGIGAPYIAINGVIMAQSINMPWKYIHPIQGDVNENCIGGEVILTDFNSSPSLFNIKDIKDNYTQNTQKYFSDFDYDLYAVSLNNPLDIPMFVELVDLGGGGGLPVGQYQYSLRYVNNDGDRTNFGPSTPAIPVISRLSTGTSFYPNSLTNTNFPDKTSKTKYGVKLRFRVTNELDYDFIEIRRVSYNSGQGIDSVPQGEIVGRIDILPGEISIREFTDPKESNESLILSEEDEIGNVFFISSAKTVRYFDKRIVLMNIKVASKESGATFKFYNGKKIFPVMKGLTEKGHSDPYNNTYFKNYQSGEKYSFSIALFDGLGGKSFAVEDSALKNVQAPSRRDPLTGDSLDFSLSDYVTACDKNNNVGPTYELFSHEGGVGAAKTDGNSYKNIASKGTKNGIKGSDIGYKPYRPANGTDPVDDTAMRPNELVDLANENYVSYRPKSFRKRHYTKGFALGGLENIPNWAKSFSILRSEKAGRVVCQGIGMYKLNQADFDLIGNSSLATKERNKFWFHSPDIASGLVPSAIVEDMKNNPSNYKIQFVSPLGFNSEIYNFDYVLTQRDRLIDMIAYANIIKDNGDINAGEVSNMGNNGYVAYNRFRNTSNPSGGGFFNHPDAGNRKSNMTGFSPISEGRGSYFEMTSADNIYNINNTGGSSNRDFLNQGMKDFTEPMYLINIIQEGKEVENLDINSYYSTGHYQKIESLIGVGDNTLNQQFDLVDERWEDCIPALGPGGFLSNDERYVYLKKDNQERVFLNTRFYTTAQKQVIINSISSTGSYTTPLGKVIHGIYSFQYLNNINKITLVFDYAGTIPDEGEKIYVKYDNRIPIRFFGGDTIVGDNVFAPIDKEATADSNPKSTQFALGIGFPYFKWTMNARHFIHKEAGGLFADQIQDRDDFALGYIRQMIMMYNCESLVSSVYQVNNIYPTQFFPATHYVMRPNKPKNNSFSGGNENDIADDNDIFRDYFSDYPNEYARWGWGGFRFFPGTNIDYSSKGPKDFFSKPKFGFIENTDFCTGIAWSLPRATNQQNSPGLKTFLASNFYIADDDNGEIKKAWDAKTGQSGENLYGVCESGIVLLLTKKSILSNINGDDLAITASDSFIANEIWITRTVGSNGEMWRAIAEGNIELNTEGGKIEQDTLFIPNNHSIYKLSENQVRDILKDNYRNRIGSSLAAIPRDFSKEITGHYDKNHNEYWIQIEDQKSGLLDKRKTFVFDNNQNAFIGRFDYVNDKYLFFQNKNYGFKNNQKLELDKGFLINGLPISARLKGFSSIEFGWEKEWISTEVFTGPRGEMKPFAVFFYDEKNIPLCSLNEITHGSRYLRQYDGWYGQIPRKTINGERVQYRLIIFEIVHNFEEDFKVSGVELKYKKIK